MLTNKQAGGVAAIVLAAGSSRRMGSTVPKQLLRLGGKALLQHTLDNVSASKVSEVALVLGAQSDEIRQQISADGIRVVVNPDYQQGIGTSLRAGLSALSDSARATLIVLADQPFVAPRTLDCLIDSHSRSQAQITIPLYRGFRGNPVLLDRSVFPELMTLSGDVGCRAIFGSHTEGIYKIEVDDPGILLDIDTAADLQKLEQFAGIDVARQLRMPALEQRRDDHNSPDLVIVGHDVVCRALGALAQILRFTVTFVDPLLGLKELPEGDRVLHVLDFSKLPAGKKFVVVASRGQFDEEAVEQALISDAAYVGLLANRKRAQEVMNALRSHGIPAKKKVETVHSPAGLSLGAETPEEIALSILAEILASRSKS